MWFIIDPIVGGVRLQHSLIGDVTTIGKEETAIGKEVPPLGKEGTHPEKEGHALGKEETTPGNKCSSQRGTQKQGISSKHRDEKEGSIGESANDHSSGVSSSDRPGVSSASDQSGDGSSKSCSKDLRRQGSSE
jgi:hypothetical protein